MKPLPIALLAPNPHVPIRPVRLTDADSLYADCWPSRSFSVVYNLIGRAIRSRNDGRGLGIVVPGEGNRVLGYGQLLLWPSCAEISDMVVAEPYRGHGYGTAIIQTLVRQALKMGAEEAEIGAALDNPRAASLYRKLGFTDSHTVLLNLGKGKQHVLFLRLNLRTMHTAPVRRE